MDDWVDTDEGDYRNSIDCTYFCLEARFMNLSYQLWAGNILKITFTLTYPTSFTMQISWLNLMNSAPRFYLTCFSMQEQLEIFIFNFTQSFD